MQRPLLYFSKLFILSLGIFIVYTLPSCAAEPTKIPCSEKFSNSRCAYNLDKILPELKKANVIYLGETHDSSQDHENQLKIIQELYKNNSRIAIAMEMFQRPFQKVVNQYIAGKITETELVTKTEYTTRWGFDWQLYAPILRFAKQKQIPVLALNTASEITRKVSREGIETLTNAEKQSIPPITEIRLDNIAYRQMVLKAFQQHQTAGHGNSSSANRFFLAQVLWDETMADGIAKFINANPNYQVVVLAGQGHIVYGYGIPDRVERRIQDNNNNKFIQRSVLLSVPEVTEVEKDKSIADFILEK
ncbi:ChaN family lipoprotein [Rivularia sp. UHCC 0363]|uniref:ChaN family lipoprotein n=1 Tax=Rivularia sp. UHCC 0363 TaxID=3110244 RepID=UPI002B1FBEB1|nr:ChaN family lipoprotein [Rivularia sp. UHCC 0363]MEA5597549.1 ChaN family lipoprotein [Rivularia sp. UHCC 0363]